MNGERMQVRHPWWGWPQFPLVPRFWWRQADRWNCFDWSIQWLCFRVRSKMTPDVGADFKAGSRGLFARIELPYLCLEVDLDLVPPHLAQRTWRTGRSAEVVLRGERL